MFTATLLRPSRRPSRRLHFFGAAEAPAPSGFIVLTLKSTAGFSSMLVVTPPF